MNCVLLQGRYIHEATRHIPIIGDGDTGYGNALNVKRTVRGYAAAGFAGVQSRCCMWIPRHLIPPGTRHAQHEAENDQPLNGMMHWHKSVARVCSRP